MAAVSLAAAMLIPGATLPVFAADVSDTDAMAIMRRHCVMCHARKPTHPSFDALPKNVTLETIDELRACAVKVVEQVVLDRNMPGRQRDRDD